MLSIVLSDEGRKIFDIVNLATICSIVGLFGIIANTVNMIVFYRQGFKSTVNIEFFGLAISDISCLLSLIWTSVIMNPLFALSRFPWYHIEVMYLSAAGPHVCFSRITSFITVYITAERYISIAMPLKVKDIITPKKTAFILCMIYLVNLMTFLPEYATSFLGWRFIPSRNMTLIALVFTSNRDKVEGVVYILHSVMGSLSFVGVIIFTSLLVTKLGQASRSRVKITSNQNKDNAMSTRDQKTVKMIVLIATILIVCYIPGAVIALATFIVGPEFNIRGKYINICEAMWTMAFTFQSINSSANIFLYYSMSSKYRNTLYEVFKRSKIVTVQLDVPGCGQGNLTEDITKFSGSLFCPDRTFKK